MKTISAHEFLQRVIFSNESTAEDFSVAYNIRFGQSPYRPDHKIKNCFIESLSLCGANFTDLTFEKCEIKTLIVDSSAITTLKVVGCHIDHLLITSNSNGVHQCEIRENTFISRLELQEGGGMAEILIKDNEKIDELLLSILHTTKLNISGIRHDLHQIGIAKIKSPTLVAINSLTIGTLDIKENISTVVLDDVNSTLIEVGAAPSTITNCTVSKIKIKYFGQLDIIGGSLGEIQADRVVGRISIKSSEKSSCSIEHFNLPNITFRDAVEISNCQLLVLDLSKGRKVNKGVLFTFKLCRVVKQFNIENADMNSTTLDSVDLASSSIHFLNSSWDDSKLLNVQWPSEFYEYSQEQNQQKDKLSKLNTLWSLKAGYRKFKVLSLTQNNKIDAMKFQKHELKTYWQIVHIKTWQENFRENIGIWLILGSNRVFSDFGQNIFLPLVWLFAVHSLLYYQLLSHYDLGVQLCSRSNFDWEATKAGIGMFFNLINPVHASKIESDFLPQPVSIFGTIDFFMRICSGYFIYYFLQATRKFNFSV